MKSLVAQILNGERSQAFAHLSEESEINELRCVPAVLEAPSPISGAVARSYKGQVRLKRTFTMMGMKFWRVMGPESHPNYQSDLSVEGLKEWGIIS